MNHTYIIVPRTKHKKIVVIMLYIFYKIIDAHLEVDVGVCFGRRSKSDEARLHVVEDVVVRLRIRRHRQRRKQHVQRVRRVLRRGTVIISLIDRKRTDLPYTVPSRWWDPSTCP